MNNYSGTQQSDYVESVACAAGWPRQVAGGKSHFDKTTMRRMSWHYWGNIVYGNNTKIAIVVAIVYGSMGIEYGDCWGHTVWYQCEECRVWLSMWLNGNNAIECREIVVAIVSWDCWGCILHGNSAKSVSRDCWGTHTHHIHTHHKHYKHYIHYIHSIHHIYYIRRVSWDTLVAVGWLWFVGSIKF